MRLLPKPSEGTDREDATNGSVADELMEALLVEPPATDMRGSKLLWSGQG